MKYGKFFLFFLPFLLWAEPDYRLMLSLWGGGNWHTVGYAFELKNQWAVVPTALAIGSFGASVEYSLDEVWTVWASGGYWPIEGDFYLIGDVGFHWYGNWSAPLGPAVGFGVMAWGTRNYFAVYPEVTLSYKWVWKNFFVEPNVLLYIPDLSGYIGAGLRLDLGWMW